MQEKGRLAGNLPCGVDLEPELAVGSEARQSLRLHSLWFGAFTTLICMQNSWQLGMVWFWNY